MDEHAARNAAVPVLSGAQPASSCLGRPSPRLDSAGRHHAFAEYAADGCVHGVMIVALVPMIVGQVDATFGVGLVLVAVAMALSPLSRR